jgi:FAD:protein FMN transferase
MKNAVVIVAAWSAIFSHSAMGETVTIGGPTMGTTYRVRFVAPTSSAVDVENLKGNVESLLAEFDQQMSTYRDDSELSRFNRAPAGEWFAVSKATAEVVHVANNISRKTHGALDVTVGPFVRLWHFGPKAPGDNRAPIEPPSDAELQAAMKRVGFEHLDVRLASPALRKRVDGLEVDLSSIAPGYAVDHIAARLAGRGIVDFLVEIGGEIRASGKREDGKAWRVAIERPLVDRREMQMALPLSDVAISTAGDYRKFFEHAGRRYSHVIDPATGRPINHNLAAVTVMADSCLEADASDTALLVMGADRGFEFAEQHDIAALFIVRGETTYDVQTTSAWKKRFDKPD